MLLKSVRGRVLSILLASLLVGAGLVAWRGATTGNSATAHSGTIRLLAASVQVDAGSVTVSTRVDGALDQGEVLARYTRPKLSDSTGLEVWARRSWTDPDDSRLLHSEFPLTVESPREVVFSVGDFSFQTPSEFEAMKNGEGAPVRTVIGEWSISVTLQPNPSVSVEAVNVVADFGPGSIRITGVSRSEHQIALVGEISGFSEDQVPDIVLVPASLKDGDSELSFLGGRSGFGPDRASFELTFSAPKSRLLTLTVPLNLSGVSAGGQSLNPSAIEELRPYAGTLASLSFELPQ